MFGEALIAALPSLISLVEHGISALQASKAHSEEQKKAILDDLQARLEKTGLRVDAVTFNAKPPAPPK